MHSLWRFLGSWTVAAAAMLALAGCDRRAERAADVAAAKPLPARSEGATPGLENVWHLSNKLFSGGSPDGDKGFRTLAMMGVRTIVSVDGARPNAMLAERYGLQYVHLPVTYDGIPREKVLRLAKAVKDLPGPIYLHCHHGKHRGPAAAVAAMMCLNLDLSAEAAVDLMKKIGTDPHYRGLFAVPKSLVRPSSDELEQVQFAMSRAAEVSPLAETMIRIDLHWDRLSSLKEAGWKQPEGHPEIVAADEALLLFEQLYELGRVYSNQPNEFKQLAFESRQAALDFESALRLQARDVATDAVEAAYQRVDQSCNKCHELYRDNPDN
jgi:protein tyrosine phosphatase (PTP) superfamily phosphohydrolase (DUF442 family)